MIDMNNLGHTKYEVDGPIGIITIDRADKANAVNQQTLDEMDACFTAAADDMDVKVIVLRADGKHFSSGHDMTGSNDAIGYHTPHCYYHRNIHGRENRGCLGYRSRRGRGTTHGCSRVTVPTVALICTQRRFRRR